jgi:ketosteroid isomerase-like protein
MLIPSSVILLALTLLLIAGLTGRTAFARNNICGAIFGAVFLLCICLPLRTLAAGTDAAKTKESVAKESSAAAGVTALLQMQAEAWNHGDLDTFVSGYLHSQKTSYVSSDSEVWGYEALRDRYQRKYGDKHDTMGTLKFSDLKIQDLGNRNALCIGHWHLERSEKPIVEGIFSLVLVRSNSGWKIVHDHTSVTENAADKKTNS